MKNATGDLSLLQPILVAAVCGPYLKPHGDEQPPPRIAAQNVLDGLARRLRTASRSCLGEFDPGDLSCELQACAEMIGAVGEVVGAIDGGHLGRSTKCGRG